MSKRLVITAISATAAFLVASAPAQAQYYPPPPPPQQPQPQYAGPGGMPSTPIMPVAGPMVRHGLTLGGGFGFGSIGGNEGGSIECIGDCEASGAVSFDLHVGWMVNPRLAIGGEMWVAAQALDESGDNMLTQGMAMLTAQYWLSPRWWIKAGIGSATLSQHYKPTDESLELGEGTALMGAVGWEAWQRGNYVVDIQLRFGSATYEDLDDQFNQGALSVGLSWY